MNGFAAIQGHERVRDFLRAASVQERLAHALLFAGPEGVGKRRVAQALAAFLQCTQRRDDACGECASCRQVAAGSHPDVQFVSVAAGKKEIGVERVRELKHFVQLQPVVGKAKVAIIDDAHMLTLAAQNALLKTLEEPPSRSFLILVANSPDALLPTVRSRCQTVRFAPLPVDLVQDILAEASPGIDTALLRELAVLAEGSPGRGLSLSRHLTPEGRAELEHALASLGGARYVALMRVAQMLSQPETATMMKLETLLARYRDEAVDAIGAAPDARQLPRVRSALRRTEAINEACELLRRGSPNRQLLLEALLLRLAQA